MLPRKPIIPPIKMDASMAATMSRLRPKRMAASLPTTLAKVPMSPSPVATMAGESRAGVLAAVSSIPQKAEQFGPIAQDAGADVFVVQSTVSTVRHVSTQYKSLDLPAFTQNMKIPIIIGNAVTYDVTIELMECGVAGVLIGVGPGAACTSRGTWRSFDTTRRARSASGAYANSAWLARLMPIVSA